MSARSNAALVAAGVLVGAGALSLMSQGSPNDRLALELIPNPRNFVQIREGTPFTIPAGRAFVLTALGFDSGIGANVNAHLLVNGVREIEVLIPQGQIASEVSVVAVPTGFSAPSGAVLSVQGNPVYPQHARAWGYLYP